MKCPVCGNDYRPYKWGTEFEQDGNTITARHDFFCPNCESEFSVREYFKLESADLDPVVFKEGDKTNFEDWTAEDDEAERRAEMESLGNNWW